MTHSRRLWIAAVVAGNLFVLSQSIGIAQTGTAGRTSTTPAPTPIPAVTSGSETSTSDSASEPIPAGTKSSNNNEAQEAASNAGATAIFPLLVGAVAITGFFLFTRRARRDKVGD